MDLQELISKGWKYHSSLHIMLYHSHSYSPSVFSTQQQQDIRAALSYSLNYTPIFSSPPSNRFLTHIPQYSLLQNRFHSFPFLRFLGISRTWQKSNYISRPAPGIWRSFQAEPYSFHQYIRVLHSLFLQISKEHILSDLLQPIRYSSSPSSPFLPILLLYTSPHNSLIFQPAPSIRR